MRKLLLFVGAFVASALVPVAPGCSNTHVKKKVLGGSDASAGEGSVAAGTCDAGIWNYQTAACESCPATVDAGAMAGGGCPPDAGSGTYQCTLTCSDVNLSQSSIDTQHQKIIVAFTNYPLAITTVKSVYFAIDGAAFDGGFAEVSDQDYPTSLDNNVLTMDLSKMPAATFASISAVMPSGVELADACGRPQSEALDFQFTKTNGTWAASCMSFDGGP